MWLPTITCDFGVLAVDCVGNVPLEEREGKGREGKEREDVSESMAGCQIKEKGLLACLVLGHGREEGKHRNRMEAEKSGFGPMWWWSLRTVVYCLPAHQVRNPPPRG